MGVTWAAEKNILGGYGGGIFGVNDGITKEQLATALWRYAGSPAAEGAAALNDSGLVSSWAAEPVAWAVGSNILSAENGSFGPQSVVTRGMAADAVMRFLKLCETPYIKALSKNAPEALPQGEFIERISLKINGTDGEAVVALTDSKPTREFIAQLPMTVTFIDFGEREKFGKMPIPLSEDEALLSGYEIGDFSYGTAYDCMIAFYDQDNEVIDGVIKLGSFESGLELFSGRENIEVTISALEN
ncbi:MAG: S-layer homology domain-containing protein [Clostridia bacterium]|nr:S-layer homology domain-containing protein [Clostridia bacterium]